MDNQTVFYGIAGIAIGALITGFIMSNQTKSSSVSNNMMKNESTSLHSGSSMSMQDMMDSLKGKKGDDFDTAFISSMIAHHEGAIEMAKEAQMNAKHEEIKNLASDIITAQEKEIGQMKQWQKDWGYVK